MTRMFSDEEESFNEEDYWGLRELEIWVTRNTIGQPPLHPLLKPFLSTSQKARLLGVSVRTLERWRELQIGPSYIQTPDGEIRYFGAETLH